MMVEKFGAVEIGSAETLPKQQDVPLKPEALWATGEPVAPWDRPHEPVEPGVPTVEGPRVSEGG